MSAPTRFLVLAASTSLAMLTLAPASASAAPVTDQPDVGTEAIGFVRFLPASPDAPALAVTVDGLPIGSLANLGFGDLTGYLPMTAGDHTLGFVKAGADAAKETPLVTQKVTIAADEHGTFAISGLTDAAKADWIPDNAKLLPDKAQIRVAHLSADTPKVDVAPDGKEPVFKDVAYGTATDYAAVPAGKLDLEVRGAGTKDVAHQMDPIDVTAGTAVTAWAIGSSTGAPGAQPLRVELSTDPMALPAEKPAMVRVIHASPDGTAVDVVLGTEQIVVASGLPFSSVTPYQPVTPGTHTFDIFRSGVDRTTVPALTTKDLTFESGKRYTVVISDLVDHITVQQFTDEPKPTADQAQVRVVHLSPDAPAVDIGEAGKDPLVTNLAYQAASPYVDLKPGSYVLELRPTGANDVLVQTEALDLKAGHSYSVFAVGSAAGATNAQPLMAVVTDDAHAKK
ncbi:MAG: DUF4397 domain-containing protein [Chloroflexota bacterium]